AMIESGETGGPPIVDTVQLWDVATGTERATLKGVGEEFFGAGEAVVSPDGKVVATTNRKGIKLWDAATGRERVALWGQGFLAFGRDGKVVATVDGGTVKLRDGATGNERTALAGVGEEAVVDPDGKVVGTQAVFSPDGTILATQSREAVELWDVATGRK